MIIYVELPWQVSGGAGGCYEQSPSLEESVWTGSPGLDVKSRSTFWGPSTTGVFFPASLPWLSWAPSTPS